MAIGIANLAVRGFQVLFAIVVLGVTGTLISGQDTRLEKVPATYGFITFAGAVAMIGAAVGIAANWVEMLNGAITWGVDGVIALINLAAGVLIAYKLRGIDCGKTETEEEVKKKFYNNLLNAGEKDDYFGVSSKGEIEKRCRQAQADTAFLFLTVVILVAAILVTWFRMRNHK
ncbi:hypothetical protein EJ04DRAFT_571486 [Polyplosphaeria fusca]|uniref:MARVEL domain-containing protein n=1 Tax=Polyplosphaeria fusca TaxID=682080 RepID=A0A9P4R973_9PLEO|nr:hypothetical protein EJ04DRAFT_571486 [Polyplosphaeria fusca]